MKQIHMIIMFTVAAFGALFTRAEASTVGAPPTNNATLQFENMFRAIGRNLAVGVLTLKVKFARAFPMFDMPLGLAIDKSLDEQLLESLSAISKKVEMIGDVEKLVGEQKTAYEKLTTEFAETQKQFADLQRQRIASLEQGGRVRAPGTVSDACAKHLASQFILHCERSNKLEALAETAERRTQLVTIARNVLGITGKTALTTADIPLPTQYGSEIKELISEFGVCRRKMSPYPIGMGTARPPRMGTRPAFGSIAMSAAITEKSPTITFASLESHKIGGLVRLPREIDEQSIVPMGQYLARYGAIEFARAEDTWGFLADGSGTYENVAGVVKIATDNAKSVVLAAATGPVDATLADFRAMRTKVNKAALSGRLSAYYLDSTWETRLPTFKTDADPFAYVRNADGSATLDGYPIVWCDVLEPYGVVDVASKPLAVFGALNFWWMGEHGSPRIDTSEHVFFANDQLATRFIEEIDFDYAALDAVSVLLTGAAV